MASFFGKPSYTLVKGQSLTPISEAEALEGKKYILVYFSAHWCPPCRMFTPQLRTFYEKCHKGKNFEVIFVSLDKTVGGMRAYMETSHGNWLALPLDQANVIVKEWMEKYDFQSIPALFIFESTPTEASDEDKKTHKLVTRYGRDMLEGDPTGEKFPWPNGDAEIREHYRVLKRNIIFVTLVSIAIGLWLFRLYVNAMSSSLKK